MATLTNREGYEKNISLLRIISTVSVIWLHTCSTLTQLPEISGISEFQLRFFSAGYQMMYWAVPVFFMITGALLLNPKKNIEVKDCWNKYARRILLALILFGIPYSMIKVISEQKAKGFTIVLETIKAFLENNSFSHLWYLYALIGIYLILPVLRIFVKNANRNEIKIVLIALFAIDFVIPLLNSLVGWKIAFEIPMKYPVFYCLMGWEIKKRENNRILIYIPIIACIMILIWILNLCGIQVEYVTNKYSITPATKSQHRLQHSHC